MTAENMFGGTGDFADIFDDLLKNAQKQNTPDGIAARQDENLKKIAEAAKKMEKRNESD